MDIGVLSGQLEGVILDRCDGVRIDVTGNCNLRCPYCINDFTQIDGNVLMTEEVFDRSVQLLPLLRPGGHLLFSCYFEPTLHPRFLDFLESVPEQYRRQAGFTTNLARRLPDTFFAHLGRLGLRHVNVSLDSLTPAVFEEMRNPARFGVFRDNLERLVAALGSGGQGTELHIITMVSKRNLGEIPELVDHCATLYKARRHEIRGIWMTEEIERRPWIVQQAPSLDELLDLRRRLMSGPRTHVDFVVDLPENPEAFSPFPHRRPDEPTRDAGLSVPRSNATSIQVEGGPTPGNRLLDVLQGPPVTPVLQISSDGSIRFLIAGRDPVLDLKNHPLPLDPVSRLLRRQNVDFGRARLLDEARREVLGLRRVIKVNEWLAENRVDLDGRSTHFIGRMDDVKIVEASAGLAGGYRASGWARKPDGTAPADEVLLILRKGNRRWAVGSGTPDRQRFDVADNFSESRLLYTGWEARLHLDALADSLPARFSLAAYVLDAEKRIAYKLDGERDVELD